MVVSIKRNLLEILLLFFIILATGTDNGQPNLRLLQGYWTFYTTSQTKSFAAIWNDKVWAIHTNEEGINQAQSLDLGSLRYLETYNRTELVWQIVVNENNFKVDIINGKECVVWTQTENVGKKEAPEQAKDLKKADLPFEIGDKFLVHEKFAMFNENFWLQNGDIIEVQDLLPNGDFIFKTNDRFNLVGGISEFRKNEKQLILKQLPKTWKYEFVSKRYKQGAILLDINSPKINDIFEVKQIDQEGKLCLFKYSVTKPETGNVDKNIHKMSQISKLMTRFIDKNIKKFFLNSKTMERFYPLPFSPKNMMSKFIVHAPDSLGKHFLPCLTDYDLFLLSICFGVFPEYLSKFHNSKQYKSLCIRHCQKTFPNLLSNAIFSINLETSYKLKASNFPFRKFKLILQSKNLRKNPSHISCWFLTYSQKNESYTYAGHTGNGLYPGEALEFNLHGISWPESNGRRGNLIFPEDDEEIFMRIEPYIIGESVFFKLETFYDFQF